MSKALHTYILLARGEDGSLNMRPILATRIDTAMDEVNRLAESLPFYTPVAISHVGGTEGSLNRRYTYLYEISEVRPVAKYQFTWTRLGELGDTDE